MNQLDRTVSEVNPRALRQVGTTQVGNGAGAVAFGHGSVWVANAADYSLSQIDAKSGRVATIRLAGEPGGIAPAPRGMWVSSTSTGQLLLVDAKTNSVTQSVPIGNGPTGVAVGAGAVWVANAPDGTVSRFDPTTGRIRKIALDKSPTGIAYSHGEVWVAVGRSGHVLRVDPATGSVRRIAVGNEPSGMAIFGDDVWVTVRPGSASHRGGALRLALPAEAMPYSPDPTQFAGLPQWQLLSLTNDGLVTYRKAGGLAGAARARPCHRDPAANRWRPHVHVRTPDGDSLLERRARTAGGHPARDRAGDSLRKPVPRGAVRRDRRRRRLRLARLRPRARNRHRSRGRHRHLPPHALRPEVPPRACVRHGLGRARRKIQGGGAARDRPLHDADVRPEPLLGARAEPPLP